MLEYKPRLTNLQTIWNFVAIQSTYGMAVFKSFLLYFFTVMAMLSLVVVECVALLFSLYNQLHQSVPMLFVSFVPFPDLIKLDKNILCLMQPKRTEVINIFFSTQILFWVVVGNNVFIIVNGKLKNVEGEGRRNNQKD